MKALIIRNHGLGTSWGQLLLDAMVTNLKAAPEDVEICAALEGDKVPALDLYDLVILTGGTYNLLDSERSPWSEAVLEGIRSLAGSKSKTKLLGICWGHQATHLALGGKLGVVPAGLQVGVEDMALTPLGEKFFGRKEMALREHHRRQVVIPAPGFNALAERNEIFVSESDRFLTFQGHPEMSYQIAEVLKAGEDPDELPKDGRIKDIEASTDGVEVWKVIRRWANFE